MATHSHARLQTLGGEPVMLQGVRIAGLLRGLLFEASVEQRFHNPTGRSVEVVYTFPLPYGAVLLGIEVLLGGRHLKGSVVGKRKAEADYEAALAEGDAAVMLERNPDGSHTLNLGNLAAGESCVITLRYAQTLSFEQQGIRLLIPTVIAPRYGNPLAEGGLSPHQVPEYDLGVEYPFELAIAIQGDLARSRVASPSHPIGVIHEAVDGAALIRVSLAARAVLDRDFVLSLDRLPVNSLAVLARDSVNPEHTAALISVCPRIEAQEPPRVAVKLLVDCSGSMGGDSIAAAKRALQAIVGRLGESDRFSLSRFGSTVVHRSRGLWPVKPATRLTAQHWIGDLAADLGGTEMEEALRSTFALGHSEEGDVLLVTDGEIHAIDSLLETARDSGQRVFVVGIGSSPAEATLRRLAETTGGACDFVAPGEDVEPAILRMFARLRSPRLEALELAWPEGTHPLWQSVPPKAVFDGDTVNVYAVFGAEVKGDLRLLGKRRPDAAPECLGRVALDCCIPEETDTVARLAAARRLLTLGEAAAGELAVAYRLVSDYTNFLLVHGLAEDEKTGEMPELHQVRQMLAAGWGGAGSVAAPPGNLAFSRTDEGRYDQLSSPRPAFSRKAAFSGQGARGAPLDVEHLDIPAFLRRAPGDASGVPAGSPAAPPQRPGFFSRLIGERTPKAETDRAGIDGDGHLTPRGMLTYLLERPWEEWPKTYAGLAAIGLRPEIVAWLEQIFASEYPVPKPERAVVEAFLRALLTDEIRRAVLETVQFPKQRKRMIEQGLGKAGPAPELVDDLVAYFRDVTPERWPSPMAAELAVTT